MDNNDETFRGLVDAVFAHPSTKPHIPTSVREVQLEAEIDVLRGAIDRAIAVIRTSLARLERIAELDTWDNHTEESPF